MERWRRISENAGRWQAVRAVLVLVVFAVIAIGYWSSGGGPWATLAFVVGVVMPWPLRGLLTRDPALTARVLAVVGRVLFAVALVAGFARDHLDALQDDAALLPGLVLAVSLYASAFLALFSDPTVVREG